MIGSLANEIRRTIVVLISTGAPAPSMQDALQIGLWTFHPQLHQLTGPDGDVHLEPRTAAVLADLAHHAGQVRSREELLAAVWGNAFVGEAVLTHCVWELRRAFRDSARQPRYIQTIPRRGYRLLATVEPLTGRLLRTLLLVEGLSISSSGDTTSGRDPAEARLTAPYSMLTSPECHFSLFLLERPIEALRLALDLDRTAIRNGEGDSGDQTWRAVVHLGEVPGTWTIAEDATRTESEIFQHSSIAVCKWMLALARPRQILLTRGAFDLARAAAEELGEAADPRDGNDPLRWLAHGAYAVDDSWGLDQLTDGPIDLFEVGVEGVAPLRPPAEGLQAKRVASDGIIRGWRAAQGLTLPSRPHWRLRRKLGEGGFGEVWLAAHDHSGLQRVLKFCYEAERLRALQREATLFRLLKTTLGERQDIVRIIDWNFEKAPYFLEIEHTESGSLPEWADLRGGLDHVPLALRLEIVAQMAEALAAAHSVGVLHKDVKPSNILIQDLGENTLQARLTDFGISRVTDKSLFAKVGITALGISGMLSTRETSSNSGTRLYQAPEVLEGKPFTTSADIFALGVVLYQLVVGDLERAMAVGWDRQVDDPLLIETIASCVDGSPQRRPSSALELAKDLRSLESRRRRRQAEEQVRREAARNQQALAAALRRRKTLAAATLITTLVLCIVALFALQANRQRRAAEAARQEAEWRHLQAEGLVGFMLGDLRDKLEPLGRLDILEEVGDRAMLYFEQVPEEHWSDEERIRRSLALRQIGDVRLAQGNLDAAQEAFAAALALVPADSQSFDLQGPQAGLLERQAEALSRIGQSKRSEGDLLAAETAFRQALELSKTLAEAAPDDSDRHISLCASYFWVGQIHYDQGDYMAAKELMSAYLETAASWAARQPENDTWQLELAQATSNMGSIFEKTGDLVGALQAYRRRLGILENLVRKDPSHTAWQLDLALAHNTVGVALAADGRLAEAEEHFSQDLEIKQTLVAADPSNALWRQRLATSHYYLGKNAWQQGQLDTAKAHFNHQLDLARDLVIQDPRNGHWRRELGIAQTSLGQVLSWQGDQASSRGHLEEAERHFLALLDQKPEHRDWQLRLARGRIVLAYTLLAQGQMTPALSKIEATLKTLRRLEPSDPTLQAEASLLRGLILHALDRTAEAKVSWQQSRDLIRPLAQQDGSLEHLALWVRALHLLGLHQEAAAPLAALDAAGYQEPRIPQLSAP